MSETTAIFPSAAADVGGVRCRECGYDLRGIDVAGRCPECGAPVASSLRGELLRSSSPAWLRTLRIGLHLIIAGTALAFVIAIGTVALTVARQLVPNANRLLPILSFAAGGVALVGTWLVTEPDPSGVGEATAGRLRRFVRLTLACRVAGGFVHVIRGLSVPSPALLLTLNALDTLAGAITLAGGLAFLVYLVRLARRIPDEPLARSSRSLAWWAGIVEGVLLLLRTVVLEFGVGRPTIRGLAAGLSIVFALLSLATLAVSLARLLLIVRFVRRIGVEETVARAAAPVPQASLA